MIKSAIIEYIEGMKQCIEVKNQAKDYIKQNYLPDSVVGAEAMKQCETTFTETTTPLKESYKGKIQKYFDEMKEGISKAVLNPIPDELQKMLPMLDKMTAMEKQMLLDKYKNNYMASKILNQGNDSFMTLEHLRVNHFSRGIDITTL